MPTITSLNAADYGMVPNTGTDQTANFQTAINAAQTERLPLYIPEGTYLITTVSITEPAEIYSSPGAATIGGFNQSPMIDISPSGANRFGPVRIADLFINAQHQSFAGSVVGPALIRASQVNDLTIERCNLRDSAQYGIYLNQCAGRIIQNTIEGSNEAGAHSLDAEGLSIETNVVRWSGNNGIQVWRSSIGSDGTIVARNTVGETRADSGGTGPNGNAISVFRANYVTVADNKIYNSAFSAVRLNSSSGSHILGNQSWDCKETAIWVEFTYEGGVVANNIVQICGSGISVTNVNEGGRRVVVSGNQVVGCTNNTIVYEGGTYQTWGGGIGGEGDVLIVGNQVEDADDWGLVLLPTNIGNLGTMKVIAQAENNMLKNCSGGIGFYKDDTTYGRLFIGGNTIYGYSSDPKYGALVPIWYDGVTGEVTRLPGSTDLGNATTSGFPNVALLLNYAFN